jgi:uncharacterized protein
MPQDLIRYDLLVQDALKGVVRRVLSDAASEGMPGEHHFYVSFRTQDPGVRISQRLRDKYPDEMTIVLQHQFWDLAITEHSFEVGLSFSGIPERLLVPFESLTGFFDPSVQFGLKFELSSTEPADNDEEGQDEELASGPAPAPIPLGATHRRGDAEAKPAAKRPEPKLAPAKLPARDADKPARLRSDKADAKLEPASGKAGAAKNEPAKSEIGKSETGKSETGKAETGKPDASKPDAGKVAAAKADAVKGDSGKGDGAEVVSLDAFRKKT